MSQLKGSDQSVDWRTRLHEIIFEADTVKGRLFDIILLAFIVLSVIAVAWESLPDLDPVRKHQLYIVEWVFTVFFTIEYVLRLIAVLKPLNYAKSFYGIIDLLSVLPTYISLVIIGSQSLLVIRALRLLRLFRIFKMAPYLSEGDNILKSVKSAVPKLTVFIYFVLLMVCIFGAVMYLVEGHDNDRFDSIPRSMYWAIVTLTTVGYGDIAPVTALGQLLSAILMITGYAVIAVPTGIVSAEIVKGKGKKKSKKQKKIKEQVSTQSCRFCAHEGHEVDAIYCKFCGEKLNEHH